MNAQHIAHTLISTTVAAAIAAAVFCGAWAVLSTFLWSWLAAALTLVISVATMEGAIALGNNAADKTVAGATKLSAWFKARRSTLEA